MAVSEDSLIVGGGKRGRGRPPVDDPLIPVTFCLRKSYIERLDRLASLYEVDRSPFCRKAMERVIDRAID